MLPVVEPRAALGARGAVLPLAAIGLTALNLRTAVTGFSPLLETIGDEVGFGESLFGVLGTIVTACFAVFGLLAPVVARRVGLEVTIVAATLLTTVGILLRASSPGAVGVVLSTVVAFAGVGTSNVIIVPLVKKYFPGHLKAVSSGYLALLQVGQFTAPLIAVPLAATGGWRFALGVWAIPLGVAVVLWSVFAVRHGGRPRGRVDAGKADAGSADAEPLATPPAKIAGAWRSSLLWSMVLMFGMTALNTYAVLTWLPTIMTDAGADPATSGSLLALFSVFGLFAAFIVPPLTLKMSNPFPLVLLCVLFLATGYAGLMIAPLTGAVAWVVLLGLGVSTFPLCLTLVNARTRTPAGSSTLSGAMQGLGYGLACIGPLCIGLLYSATRSWTGSYLLLFATLVVMLASGFVACKPRLLEDTLRTRTASPDISTT